MMNIGWRHASALTLAALVGLSGTAAAQKPNKQYVSCVTHAASDLKATGFLNTIDHGKIQSCAAKAK